LALNIRTNDVAKNMGLAVGANALSKGGANLIAAIAEIAHALLRSCRVSHSWCRTVFWLI